MIADRMLEALAIIRVEWAAADETLRLARIARDTSHFPPKPERIKALERAREYVKAMRAQRLGMYHWDATHKTFWQCANTAQSEVRRALQLSGVSRTVNVRHVPRRQYLDVVAAW